MSSCKTDLGLASETGWTRAESGSSFATPWEGQTLCHRELEEPFLPLLLVWPGWDRLQGEEEHGLNSLGWTDICILIHPQSVAHSWYCLLSFSTTSKILLLILIALKLPKQTVWCCWAKQRWKDDLKTLYASPKRELWAWVRLSVTTTTASRHWRMWWV